MQASPNRIGKYELISRLGRGGMGEVYKAFHPQLQRYVAIKVLLTSSDTDPEFITRFQNEARAVARLRHPHIVQVFDFDIEGDKPYMVMEFVEGETLGQRMIRYHNAGKLMPTNEIVRLFQQICAAVNYAHKQGMLHRDIKPANVIINHQNDAILTDFGLAKIAGVSGLTASGTVMGTPHYMSPEQGQGFPIDERSDVYSLSVMLYELLAGKPPFNADTPIAIIMQHIMAPPPPIEEANPAVSSALAQVALLGMAKKPDERFRSAAALAAAIAVTTNQPPAHITPGAPARSTPGAPRNIEPVTIETQAGPRAQPGNQPPASDTVITTPAETPNAPTPLTLDVGKAGKPPAIPSDLPPMNHVAGAPQVAPPVVDHSRRKANRHLGRFAISGIILLLLIIGGGILLIALGNKGNTSTSTTPTVSSVGTVTFSDSDPNDFTHPADTLQATLTNLKQPAGGSTYFAWLCDSGASGCAFLGPVLTKSDGSAALSFSTQGENLLGVSDPTQLATILTVKITQEQTEASSPPASPSTHVVYSGQIPSAILLHIRHLLVAIPKNADLFPGNTTALDTGLGVDARLLQQLAQQLQTEQSANDLDGMRLTAEDILNLIVGKEGQRDWNQDGHTDIAPGDDGFGFGTDATVDLNNCAGPQDTSYLPLTMQHACLTAKTSGSSNLEKLFTMIQAAGANITRLIKQVEQAAQTIAIAPDVQAISSGEVNTLAGQADTILNGLTGETQNEDGARQILLYSEAMAIITINPA